ncbi:rhomboid family intramembrane serine protease [Schaalia sp. 19OD2882]|uniref:rhomboid family intramembrane serine protease n=1 Tax=Schaalia sp. 19OD2882 TaxID=2794089 RepID=UPI0020A724F6|nr:rhomboid family intramembrane serine protease [Schaalia sp. 19OD2882]
MCIDCVVRTEVRSLCVDCAGTVRRARRSATRGPIVTYVMMGLCALVFLVDLVSPAVFQAMAFTPQVGQVEPWRFLTTAFLHGGLMHIFFNMLSLYWVGRALEEAMGAWRFALLYVLSAVGGSLAVLVWVLFAPATWTQVTVGASGAVFGLYAAVFVLQRKAGVDTRSVLVLLGVNLVYGFMVPNVSWQAHLGGMVVGALVTWGLVALARPRPGVTAKAQDMRSVATGVAMAVALAGLVLLTYRVLFEVLG